jgi:hypothetical protein
MSTTTSNLPATPPPKSASNDADDLLSQLAGEEIDRLIEEQSTTEAAETPTDATDISNEIDKEVISSVLAEAEQSIAADVQSTPTPTPTLPAQPPEDEIEAPSAPAPTPAPVPSPALDESHEEPPEPVSESPPAPEPTASEPAPAEPSPPAEDDLDVVAGDMMAAGEVVSEDEVTQITQAGIAKALAEDEGPALSAVALVTLPGSGDKSAGPPKRPKLRPHLGPPFLTAVDKWHPDADRSILDDLPDIEPNRLGPLVRTLALLNRPFENLGDDTREALGRIAIFTLFFAAAVVAYVMFARG